MGTVLTNITGMLGKIEALLKAGVVSDMYDTNTADQPPLETRLIEGS